MSFEVRDLDLNPMDRLGRLRVAATDFEVVGPRLARIVDNFIPTLVEMLEETGAPFSGGGEHLEPADDMRMDKKLWKRF